MAAVTGQAAGLATLAAGIWDGMGRAWGLASIGVGLVVIGTAAELAQVRRGGVRRAR